MSFNPGRLRHRVTIEALGARTPDGEGGYTQPWATFKTVRAEYEPFSGSEQMEAMQMQGSATGRFRIWYRSDVTPDMRIRMGDRLFAIIAPPSSPGEKREITEIMVSEYVPPVVVE